MAKVAINGFGRIGRLFFRQLWGKKSFDIVAINDLGDLENLAYLLQYDTVYGKFEKTVEVMSKSLVVGGGKIAMFQEKDPTKLPWGKLGVDIEKNFEPQYEDVPKRKETIENLLFLNNLMLKIFLSRNLGMFGIKK